jgi:hypothetical protein
MKPKIASDSHLLLDVCIRLLVAGCVVLFFQVRVQAAGNAGSVVEIALADADEVVVNG